MMGFIIMFSYMYLTYSNHTSAFITLYCSPPTPFLPASPFSFLSLSPILNLFVTLWILLRLFIETQAPYQRLQ